MLTAVVGSLGDLESEDLGPAEVGPVKAGCTLVGQAGASSSCEDTPASSGQLSSVSCSHSGNGALGSLWRKRK